MCRSHADFHPNLTINIESTGTTSFMPVSKVWPLMWWSSRNLVTQYTFVVISCTEFYLNQAKNVEDMDKILFMLLSICQYSWILHLFNTIVFRSFLNFTPISQEVLRIWVDIHLYVEENMTLTELIITKLWLVWHFFCSWLIYWILWKFNRLFSHWYCVTDRLTDGHGPHVRYSSCTS